jgi:uncharacterized membrane protein AbrB (regulator of aidB expression)
VAIATGNPSSGSELQREDLLELALVTALGEELIYRGFLLGVALVATRPGRLAGARGLTQRGYWIVSIGVGLWHIADAIESGDEWSWSLEATAVLVVGAILVTTLASRFRPHPASDADRNDRCSVPGASRLEYPRHRIKS